MISVILLTHNYAKYLPECLDSVLNNLDTLVGEIIIINDKSTDNTREIVQNYKKKSLKIKYFETSFLSLSKSYNFAISKSKFEYITKIDADDIFEKDFLSSFYSELVKNSYDFIFGDIKVINQFSTSIGSIKQKKKLYKFLYKISIRKWNYL